MHLYLAYVLALIYKIYKFHYKAGKVMFTISVALEELKAGNKVARKGWNGANQFIWYVPPGSYPARMEAIKGYFPDDKVPYGGYLALKNAQGQVVPWLPSQGDLLAEDWIKL